MNNETIDRITEIAKANQGHVVRRQDISGANRTDSFFIYFDGFKNAEIKSFKWDAIEAIRVEFPEPTFKLFAKKSRGYTMWNLVDDTGYTGERRVGFEVREKS